MRWRIVGMTDKVHFLFHTKAIKHLKKLNAAEREKTLELIKAKVYGFLYHDDRRYLTQDHYFSKMGMFESTIYYVRIDLNKRAIISVDEDPIFEEVRVNIYAICNRDSLQREINGVTQSLYQKMINDTPIDEEVSE